MSSATVRFDGLGSSVVIPTRFGPRIAGLFIGSRNLFAERPDGPGPRPFGGHGLWASSDGSGISDRSDEAPITLTRAGDGILIEGRPSAAEISKALTITGVPRGWIIDHKLVNHGRRSLRIAPCAITRFRPGGLATLPFAGAGGIGADRALVLWPSTDPTDTRLSLTRDRVGVEASTGSEIKVGVAGAVDRARYELDGVRVDMIVTVDPTATYPDLGAAIQVSVGDGSCEIATLGPIAIVPPGGSVTHREEWEISEVSSSASASR